VLAVRPFGVIGLHRMIWRADPVGMAAQSQTILKLRVPIIVRLGEREMTVREVLALVPGSIIDLDKPAEDEIELLVNNRAIASGTAVKIDENFGIRLTSVGDASERLEAARG